MPTPTPSPDLPAPPVPADLDLRRLWWMKLDIGALLNSDFNTEVINGEAWRAGVTLYMKAWHQVPAGSLPNSDVKLCHLAGLGRDLRTWRKIKADALHGFTLCNDGRLYHRFLCGMALEAFDEVTRSEERRQRERDRKRARCGTVILEETTETDVDPLEADESSEGIPTEDDAVSDGTPTEILETSDGIPAENSTQYRTLQDRIDPPLPPRSGGQRLGKATNHQPQSSAPRPPRQSRRQPPAPVTQASTDAIIWRNRLANGPGGVWLGSWGPRPDEPHCAAPLTLVRASPWGREVQRMAA